ncbi:uncharacterized protein LOC123509058 isoform X1 [Portunus trituberculatus]|uniref:uncharacterized protein LOC123509058 isoform X1 n=1 Tax=Portunus trituberculatus TaxID=210409 RepID=UPI001E1CB02E|nr:uncharacterized protein LOC123509058 isoform X1 [Portunus trituberculatus]
MVIALFVVWCSLCSLQELPIQRPDPEEILRHLYHQDQDQDRGGPPTGAAATTTLSCGRGWQGRAGTHPLHRPTQIQGRHIQEVDTAGKEEKRTSTLAEQRTRRSKELPLQHLHLHLPLMATGIRVLFNDFRGPWRSWRAVSSAWGHVACVAGVNVTGGLAGVMGGLARVAGGRGTENTPRRTCPQNCRRWRTAGR